MTVGIGMTFTAQELLAAEVVASYAFQMIDQIFQQYQLTAMVSDN